MINADGSLFLLESMFLKSYLEDRGLDISYCPRISLKSVASWKYKHEIYEDVPYVNSPNKNATFWSLVEGYYYLSVECLQTNWVEASLSLESSDYVFEEINEQLLSGELKEVVIVCSHSSSNFWASRVVLEVLKLAPDTKVSLVPLEVIREEGLKEAFNSRKAISFADTGRVEYQMSEDIRMRLLFDYLWESNSSSQFGYALGKLGLNYPYRELDTFAGFMFMVSLVNGIDDTKYSRSDLTRLLSCWGRDPESWHKKRVSISEPSNRNKVVSCAIEQGVVEQASIFRGQPLYKPKDGVKEFVEAVNVGGVDLMSIPSMLEDWVSKRDESAMKSFIEKMFCKEVPV